MQRFFWIDIKYACFAIISHENVIIDAAPIAKWMVGKTLKDVKGWLISKQAKVIEIKSPA